MAVTGLRKVSGRPRITPVNDAPLTRTETLARNLRLAWTSKTAPTPKAVRDNNGSNLSSRISGNRVAGSVELRGGTL